MKYKSETYKGYKITFHAMHSGYIGAKVDGKGQFIGIGKTKASAFADAKDSIDKFKR